MRSIDGSAGGGQLLRTALTLSVITDTPVRIESIRGSRPEPGLAPQHLAAVDLLATYSHADVDGAELGSETVTFEPGGDRQHTLEATIPTAGSVTLLLDAVVPLALVADDPVTVTATGGTDVTWSPTVAYLQRVKFPLLSRFGLSATLDVERTGFYPAGGGAVTLRLSPSTLSPFALQRRGSLDRVAVYSKASADLAARDVARRQADQAVSRLRELGLAPVESTVSTVETRSTGSSILVCGVYDRSRAGFDALGERGVPAETVADRAVDAVSDFEMSAAAVESHMADQLLVFLALAGGQIRVPSPTEHVRTALSLLAAFEAEIDADEHDDGTVTLGGSALLDR